MAHRQSKKSVRHAVPEMSLSDVEPAHYTKEQRERLVQADEEARQLIEEWKKLAHKDEAPLIEKAYRIAREAHMNQFRATGEPYIVHPIAATRILIDIGIVDEDTIAAALLHDTVEDTDVTFDYLVEACGQDVADLVDGVTKLSRISYSSQEEKQAQNYRKMFLAMAKDIRVVIIKLADRLHNMRTIDHMDPDKQIETARETIDIYAPLAARLGIHRLKWEIEDLSLRYLDPDAYYELVGMLSQRRSDREKHLQEIIALLREKVAAMGIKADIEGRPKHFYSIYRKMRAQQKEIYEIYDLFASRIIVSTVSDCYAVLGLVHELFKPIPGRFKDYIAVPKSNGYQSLHTTVIGNNGIPFEVQIRTEEMHRTAEYGIAAHWRYKEGVSDKKHHNLDVRLSWLRQLLEWQSDMSDAKQYMDSLKEGLIPDEVFVFTPMGEVIALPAGAVPVDFAYHIHSDIGNSMYGAKVNGHMVPLTYELNNGDIVEILTSDKVRGPSRDWLGFVKSSTARNKISTWFRRERRDENIIRGRELLEREIKNSGFQPSDLMNPDFFKPLLKRHSMHKVDDLLAGVGYGGFAPGRIVPRLRDAWLKTLPQEEVFRLGYRITKSGQILKNTGQMLVTDALMAADKTGEEIKKKKKKKKTGDIPVVVKGIDNALVKISRCCNPVPGDQIIGFITRGSGVAVHRIDCPNIRRILTEFDRTPEDAERAARLIDVVWTTDVGTKRRTYPVDMQIIARDRPNLLAEISVAIAEEGVSVQSARIQSARDISASLRLIVEISDQSQYDRLVGRVKAIDGVVRVTRGHNPL